MCIRDSFRGNLHDAHFGYDHVHGAFGRQRQRTFLEDFGCAFGRVFHGQDHLVGTREQVHRTAHAGGFLARDDPVGQVAFFIDLQGSQYRSVHMTAADDAERGGAVEARGALEGRDESAAGIDKFGEMCIRDRCWLPT